MRVITTKYLAPTNNLGSRIKVTAVWGSKTYPYDWSAKEPHKTAFDLFLAEQNKLMAEKYPDCQKAQEGGWWKLVAYADSLDNRGLTFIIK